MSEETLQTEQAAIVEPVTEKKAKKPSSGNLDLGGMEFFFEKNKKAITYGGGAVLAIIAIFSFYKFYWLPGQEKEANNELYIAQTYFEKDSFNLALNGGVPVQTTNGQVTMVGFKDLADNYSSTKVGNLSNYYAGICLLRTGKFQDAIDYLEKFDGNDEMLAPVAIGATGDAYMELNNVDEAIKFYLKAAEKSTNAFTTPIYLKKAGFAYEQKANYTEALATYERLKNEYSKSSEARDIEKYIARVKVLGNIQ
jgi:tetratricopeptide (TPR) repeat protein